MTGREGAEPQVRIELAAVCTIEEASAIASTCKDALERAVPVSIDAAAVQRIDTAAMQVLVALVRTASERSLPCCWDGVSEAVTEAADRLDLGQHLHLDRRVAR